MVRTIGVTLVFALSITSTNCAQADLVLQSFNYTGISQSFLVPVGVTSILIDAWGAQGWSGVNAGGFGGYSKGTLSVTPGETLNIFVGGQGTVANVTLTSMGGGFNGGGHGYSNISGATTGGGGGASDVRKGGTTLTNRVIVAAGGGGSADPLGPFGGGGGNGGGTAGTTAPGGGGAGGTQVTGGVTGGAFGLGGNATSGYKGGGGGGWYGGGVSSDAASRGGGGGSSYLGSFLTTALTMSGQQTGNGLVRFTFDDPSVVPEAGPILLWSTLLASVLLFSFVRRGKVTHSPR
jgi:hypothetical protein